MMTINQLITRLEQLQTEVGPDREVYATIHDPVMMTNVLCSVADVLPIGRLGPHCNEHHARVPDGGVMIDLGYAMPEGRR